MLVVVGATAWKETPRRQDRRVAHPRSDVAVGATTSNSTAGAHAVTGTHKRSRTAVGAACSYSVGAQRVQGRQRRSELADGAFFCRVKCSVAGCPGTGARKQPSGGAGFSEGGTTYRDGANPYCKAMHGCRKARTCNPSPHHYRPPRSVGVGLTPHVSSRGMLL